MNIKKPILTEKSLFQGKEIVTISCEIPKELYDTLVPAHRMEVSNGSTSLTFEQFAGSILQIGYNWTLYSHLKKTFDK
jgi:hypothetical protein